jgi:hypothetical protein
MSLAPSRMAFPLSNRRRSGQAPLDGLANLGAGCQLALVSPALKSALIHVGAINYIIKMIICDGCSGRFGLQKKEAKQLKD